MCLKNCQRSFTAIAALVILTLAASACSADSTVIGSEAVSTTETGSTTDSASTSDSASTAESETSEGDAASSTDDASAATDEDTETAGTAFAISGSAGPPISAAEAFEAFGPLEQEWTGPPHRELLCADFPAEHVLAVLGRSSLTADIEENRCLVNIDDGHYLLKFSMSAIDTTEDWELWIGTASLDDSVPLDIGDNGITSTAFLPMAAVRDGSVFWFVTIEGVSNADELFTTDTALLKEMLVVLTSRWSFDTQVGDVLQWAG